MMLRALVTVLVLANLIFWGWSEGALQPIGLAPAQERDPARMSRQLRPDTVRVLPAAAATAALHAASAAGNADASPLRASTACLEAGPFTAETVEAAERTLATASLPAASWERISRDTPAQLAVVLGPFTARDARQKKSSELGRLRLPFEAIDLPGDGADSTPQPAFALGRYERRSDADAALAAFSLRGVHNARVVVLRQASNDFRLRAENASPEVAERFYAISAATTGARVTPCAAAPPSR